MHMIVVIRFICLFQLITITLVDSTSWESAREARLSTENFVKRAANVVSRAYRKKGAGKCRLVSLCSGNQWSTMDVTVEEQFLSATNSCTIFDTDSNGKYRLTVTGRNRVDPSAGYASRDTDCNPVTCTPELLDGDNYMNFYGNMNFSCNLTGSREEKLLNSGCVQSSDKGECSVARHKLGFLEPSPDSISDGRAWGDSEQCAAHAILGQDGLRGNGLLRQRHLGRGGRDGVLSDDDGGGGDDNYDENLVRAFSDAHPGSGWMFMGFQDSGTYVTYPSTYQCHMLGTLVQDVRSSSWYAGALTPRKDVVVVITYTSRLETTTEAKGAFDSITHIINTLDDYDRVNVIISGCMPMGTRQNTIVFNHSQLVVANEETKAKLVLWVQEYFRYCDEHGGINGPNMIGSDEPVYMRIGSALRLLQSDNSTRSRHLIWICTDNRRLDGDVDKLKDTVREHNLHMGSLTGHVVIYTVPFGRSKSYDDKVSKDVSCMTGGLYRRLFLEQSPNLPYVTSQYFIMDAMLYAPEGSSSGRHIYWTPIHENAQGRGPAIAACTGMYKKKGGISTILGVVCMGIPKHSWETLPGFAEEWKDMQESTSSNFLTDGPFSESKREEIRATIHCETECDDNACDDDNDYRMIWVIGTSGLLITMVYATYVSKNYIHRGAKIHFEDDNEEKPVNDLWAEANSLTLVNGGIAEDSNDDSAFACTPDYPGEGETETKIETQTERETERQRGSKRERERRKKI